MVTTPNIPEILLLCQDEAFITAFNDALRAHWPSYSAEPKIKITPINEQLASLASSTTFDLIVSPANSYGRLDGAFDRAISLAFSPAGDFDALTREAQSTLYERWRGFAPPGTCTLVEFPAPLKENPRGCSWVALCPTMRVPSDVRWDREVVYECVWSLLCQVEGFNRTTPRRKIKRMLMTPLAVGTGWVSAERWAAQTVLAMKHFVDAVERPERWSQMDWSEIRRDCGEVAPTWKR